MIRLVLLTATITALVPLSPLGCPPADLPPDLLLPTERAALTTTAEAPATANVGETVLLQADAVARPDGGTISVAWMQTAGPGVPIANATHAAASFVAPSLAQSAEMRFMVTTHDEGGAVGRADVAVTVAADPNHGQSTSQPAAPVVNAGADQWALSGEQVTLDGSKSTGSGLAYSWRQVSGPPVTFNARDAAQVTFQAPNYDPNDTLVVAELTVIDATGRGMTDRTQVKIGDPTLSDTKVQIETTKGTIVLALNRAKAPVTVGNFLWYIDDRFYDGTLFHRVIPQFVVQGGGFLPGLVEKKVRDPIINEASNGLSNVRGTIAMARTSAPNTATSQFFINVANNIKGGDGQSDLDPGGVSPDGYAVFGEVSAGMGVVDQIAAVTTGTKNGFQDVPVEDVVVTSIRRLPAGS
jgi:cyclophilin family peptidyl-prolyl cis-trans isomerase